jgi:hypothetical protein
VPTSLHHNTLVNKHRRYLVGASASPTIAFLYKKVQLCITFNIASQEHSSGFAALELEAEKQEKEKEEEDMCAHAFIRCSLRQREA